MPIESTDIFSAAPYALDCHQCIRHDTAPIYFLLSRRGNGMETHVGAEGREGRLALRRVLQEYLAWVPAQYEWCEMILAPVLMRSVYNLCMKVGFKDLGKQPFRGAYTNLMVYNFSGE